VTLAWGGEVGQDSIWQFAEIPEVKLSFPYIIQVGLFLATPGISHVFEEESSAISVSDFLDI
jgi:hypothetical protein